jgi:hypothetical protein
MCGVCALETESRFVEWQDLGQIPNAYCLMPKVSHPAHDLFDGMLLEPSSICHQSDLWYVNVCNRPCEHLPENFNHGGSFPEME